MTDERRRDDPELIRQLSAEDLPVALDAAETLAQLGSSAGRDVILGAMRSPDEDVRIDAAVLAGELGATWATDALGQLVTDPSTEVRQAAIFALLDTCRPAAVDFLLQALVDEDLERREDARVALAALVGPAVTAATDPTIEARDEFTATSLWWTHNSANFQRQLCYYAGIPADLGDWINVLDQSSAESADDIARRLHVWTGAEFPEPSQDAIAARWRAWWNEHKSHYVAGRRYYFGWPVD